MKKAGEKGITLVEMIVGMTIGSLVIAGAYKLKTDISRGMDREAEKAVVQSDLVTVTGFIERDIRLAGYSLPGNGIQIINNNDELEMRLFTNLDNTSTITSNQVNTGGYQIPVADTEGFITGGWVCIEIGGQNRYFMIKAINNTSNIIELETPVGGVVTLGRTVYKADCVLYRIEEGIFYRELADNSYRISDRIDTLALVARDGEGEEISGDFAHTRMVTIFLGGIVNSGGVEHLVTESTDVSIRNAGDL